MKAFLIVLTLVLAVAVSPASAAKGGNGGTGGGGGGSEVTGTIDLMPTAGAEAGAAPAGPHYGGTVEFDTTVNGDLAKKSSVYITVVCMQDDTVVYQYSGPEGTVFPLADQAGQGLDWDGGAAECSATLIYKVDKGRTTTINWLDIEEFAAQGA
ncbi:MAG: hypothetical protein OES57_13200 [Acidimicrobiia bacterium]|nr:hypothetical protein [Acidimicrobiia bacterium]